MMVFAYNRAYTLNIWLLLVFILMQAWHFPLCFPSIGFTLRQSRFRGRCLWRGLRDGGKETERKRERKRGEREKERVTENQLT